MVTTPPRKPNPVEREKIECLVYSLFRQNSTPFFDKDEISGVALDEFIKSVEVYDVAYSFVGSLYEIWNKKNLGQPLVRLKTTQKDKPVVELHLFNDLSPDSQPSPMLAPSITDIDANSIAKKTMQNMTPPEPVPPIQSKIRDLCTFALRL